MGVINYKDFSTRPDMVVGSVEAKENSVFRKNLRIEGWLEARNLVGACKGLFASADTLKVAYPKPLTGWYAFVGDTFPAAVYRAVEGSWIATGKKGYPAEDYEQFLKVREMWKLLTKKGKQVIHASHIPELSKLLGKITFEQLSDISMDDIATALQEAGYNIKKSDEGDEGDEGESATSAVSEAIEKANTAAESATSAAESATSAANSANTAAEAANEAAQAAKDAAASVGSGTSGNADTATKLAEARKLWGQSFDGSEDVSGDMSDVGEITASGLATLNGGVQTNKITLVNGDYTATIELDDNGNIHVSKQLYSDTGLSVGGSDS